jgi:type IV pilus assembly protein PilW
MSARMSITRDVENSITGSREMGEQVTTKAIARAGGFSLVELMIALVLGTVIVLGAVGLFIANQRTFQLQRGMTDVQQQGSFTQGFVANDLRQAGYIPTGGTGVVGVLFATATNPSATINDLGGTAQTINLGTEGGAGASDRLTFAFYGTQDCEGDNTGGGSAVRIIETYYVQNGALYCQGSLDAGTTGTMLLSGVPSFQVLYGVDAIQDQQAIVTRYVNATDAAANPAWQVVAVKLGYIVQETSGNKEGVDVSSNRTYMLLDQKLVDGTAPLDATNQVRREFVTTVPIRNYNWSAI